MCKIVLSTAVIIAAACLDLHAAVATDSVRTPHVLREIEVVGTKQMPIPDTSPVTYVNAGEVNKLGISALKDVGEIAPNFYMPDYGSRMTSSIYVRGLGARIDQPVVGLSVDGVPFLNKDNYDFDIPDIERIEVLRGAQSLLNGRNTMCGQVNISTLSPWHFKGLRFMAEYARANSIKASAAYYGTISPTLASAVTLYYTHTDGFFRNEYNNARIGVENQGSARWKLSWRPSSRFSATNTASVSLSSQSGYPYASLDNGRIAYNDTCFYRRTSFADGLTIAYAGKRIVATSITSVQYLDDNMTLDQDFSTDDMFTLTQKRREWAVTQDLFAKGLRGSYSWLGGIFGLYKTTDMNAPVTFKDDGIANLIEHHANDNNQEYPIRWDERSFVLGSEFDMSSAGMALYHESSYRIGNFTIEGGLRWDIERASLSYRSNCNTSYTTMHVLPDGTEEEYSHTPIDIADSDELHHTYNQLLPKLAVSYAPGDIKMYLSYTKGYKAGGYNTQMFSDVLQQRLMAFMGMSAMYDLDDIVSYKPEKSHNYEAGINYAAPDNRVDAAATLFFIDCRDQQLTMFPAGNTTGRIMTNAGRTHSYGIELSATYRPSAALSMKASWGYTHARFKKFDDGINDYSGKQVPYAPSNTLFVSADYTLPLGGGTNLTVGANVRGAGRIYWDEANTASQPFYALLGAHVTIEHGAWSLRAWGENLTSTDYDTFYFVSLQKKFVQRGNPWQAGVTLRYIIGE